MSTEKTQTTESLDRRIAPRFQPAFATICRMYLDGANSHPTVGLVWNLSETGISMLTAERLKPGATMAAELEAEGGGPVVSIALHVVHATRVPTGDCLIGARFDRPLAAGDIQTFVTPPAVEQPIRKDDVLDGWKLPKKG